MGKNGTMGRLSDEERDWSVKAIERLKGDLSYKSIEKSGLVDEHNKLFDRQLKDAASLYQRFKGMTKGSKSKAKKSSPEYVFENSNYLVYLKDYGTSGFETEDEVKEFLEKSKILGNVILFKRVEVEVKYDIQIG